MMSAFNSTRGLASAAEGSASRLIRFKQSEAAGWYPSVWQKSALFGVGQLRESYAFFAPDKFRLLRLRWQHI